MKKRLLALGLAVCMFATVITGCGGKSTSDSGKNTDNTVTSEKKTDSSSSDSNSNKDVVKIVFYNNGGAKNVSGSEAGSSEEGYKKIQDYILEKTGILVDAILPPQEGEDEKLALLLSSGEQIDMWYGNWTEYYKTGVIQPITEYVKAESFANVYKMWDDWDAWIGVTDAQGNIWGVPRNTPATPYPVFIRVDWLDQLGMEMPSNLDELNEYLYAVKELDPYGNGSTLPLAANKYEELESCFLGGFVKGGKGMWLDESGNVMPVCLADGYLDFLTQVNKWYKDGILHPESFSWDTSTLRQYIGSGKAAATACWYSRITLEAANTTENALNAGFDLDKYKYVYWFNEKGLAGPNGELMQTRSNASSECLMIHSKCQNVQAAMDFIAWSFEWYNYTVEAVGIEGEHWIYDPNDPNAKENHTIIETGTGAPYYRDFVASLGVPMEIQTTTFDKWGRQDQHNLWLQKWHNNFDITQTGGCEYGMIWDRATRDANVPRATDIDSYISEQLIMFAIGKRDLSEYDKFIDELYKIGLDDYIAEYTRQYNEFYNR